jgi:hypothetical protein
MEGMADSVLPLCAYCFISLGTLCPTSTSRKHFSLLGAYVIANIYVKIMAGQLEGMEGEA